MHIDTEREVIFVFAMAVGILLFLIGYIIYFVILYQRRKLVTVHQMEQLQQHYRQELLRAQLEIQEQTFKNISQEIHDNIGQVLSLARLHVNTMNPGDAKDVQEKIADSDGLIGKAIQDLRDLSKSLNTAFIADIGLLRAIEYELKLTKKVTAYETKLNIEGQPRPLPPQQELILFRIFQEVLNNIIKHAHASEIQLQLCYAKDYFALNIKDNGQGFNLNSNGQEGTAIKGIGLQNIQSRAQLINAQINIQSAVAQGTEVRIRLPL